MMIMIMMMMTTIGKMQKMQAKEYPNQLSERLCIEIAISILVILLPKKLKKRKIG